MSELFIRPAEAPDIPALDRLLLQVHRVHSNARPDLFRAGAKKYTDDELAAILALKEANQNKKLIETAKSNLQDSITALLTPLLKEAGYKIVW